MSFRQTKRKPSHAGSWYSSRPDELSGQLDRWLAAVQPTADLMPARGIIAPHAGYSYSGPSAGHAYKHMNPKLIKRVFILGPSHHYYLPGCALTKHATYGTPIGDLVVDKQLNQELYSTGEFELMSTSVDEEEHSIEMHLPYIVHAMKGCPHEWTILPVMVGNLSSEKEAFYGMMFSRYLQDPSNFFVISSDFCHWGSRFSYQYYNPQHGEIFQSIEKLDKEGMQIIETQNPETFLRYQKEFKNTICGRHPIAVLLSALKHLRESSVGGGFNLRFVHYAQSSQCRCKEDSSVSYASAILGEAT